MKKTIPLSHSLSLLSPSTCPSSFLLLLPSPFSPFPSLFYPSSTPSISLPLLPLLIFLFLPSPSHFLLPHANSFMTVESRRTMTRRTFSKTFD